MYATRTNFKENFLSRTRLLIDIMRGADAPPMSKAWSRLDVRHGRYY